MRFLRKIQSPSMMWCHTRTLVCSTVENLDVPEVGCRQSLGLEMLIRCGVECTCRGDRLGRPRLYLK